MANAILWDVLQAVQTKLRTITFAVMSGDTTQPIVNDAIVIQKSLKLESPPRTPGVIVTPPLRMSINPAAGTNQRDDYAYPVLCQIVDKDGGDRSANLHTYLKWREQIARAFQQQTLSGVSDVYIGHATQVDYVDDKLWNRHQWFVGGVELRYFARLTRGVT